MGVLYQVLCTGAVCYICMSMGIMLAWPSCAILLFRSENTTLNRPMGETEISLFSGSMTFIGCLVSTPIVGYYLKIFGGKYCTLFCATMHVIGWTLIAAFKQVETILLGQFISGFGGAASFIIPVFIAEICQENIRGAMTAASMVSFGVGILVSYLLGGYLVYHVNVYVCMTIAVVGAVMLLFVRESPIFLMQRGLVEEAKASIAFYRNMKLDSEEMIRLMDLLRRALNPDLEQDESSICPEEEKLNSFNAEAPKMSVWKFIRKSRSTRQAIFLSLILMTTVPFQGFIVLQVQAGPLFKEAVPSMSSTMCSVLMVVIGNVAGFVAAYLTDSAGRRPLMIHASWTAGVCCVVFATQLQFHWGPHWFTAVIIYVYTVCHSLGAGTVPFVVMAEVFLPEVKALMTMVSMELVWLCNFIVLFVFTPLVSQMGLGPVFYIFGVICFLSAVFAAIYLPETKGKTVDVIQLDLVKKRSQKC